MDSIKLKEEPVFEDKNKRGTEKSKENLINPVNALKELRTCRVSLESIKTEETGSFDRNANREVPRPSTSRRKNKKDKKKKKKKPRNAECICDVLKAQGKPLLTKGSKRCFTLYDFRCPYCNFRGKSASDSTLQDHLLVSHADRTAYGKANVQYCGRYMNRLKKARNARLKSAQSQGILDCPKCPGSFSKESTWKFHGCCQRYVCVWCKFTTGKVTEIHQHMTQH